MPSRAWKGALTASRAARHMVLCDTLAAHGERWVLRHEKSGGLFCMQREFNKSRTEGGVRIAGASAAQTQHLSRQHAELSDVICRTLRKRKEHDILSAVRDVGRNAPMLARICLRRAFFSSLLSWPLKELPYSGLDAASSLCCCNRSCSSKPLFSSLQQSNLPPMPPCADTNLLTPVNANNPQTVRA